MVKLPKRVNYYKESMRKDALQRIVCKMAIYSISHSSSNMCLTFSQGASLVGADVRDLPELLERSHLAHNGVGLRHAADGDGHGDGDEDNGGLREDSDQGGGGVEEGLVVNVPLEGPEDEHTCDITR